MYPLHGIDHKHKRYGQCNSQTNLVVKHQGEKFLLKGMYNGHQCGVFIRLIPTCEAEPRGAVVSRDDGTGSCSHATATAAPPLYDVFQLTDRLDGSSAGGECSVTLPLPPRRSLALAAAYTACQPCPGHSVELATAAQTWPLRRASCASSTLPGAPDVVPLSLYHAAQPHVILPLEIGHGGGQVESRKNNRERDEAEKDRES